MCDYTSRHTILVNQQQNNDEFKNQKIWIVRNEGEQPGKVTVDFDKIQDLDDLKEFLFGPNEKTLYTGHFKGTKLSMDANIPVDTTANNPLIFRKESSIPVSVPVLVPVSSAPLLDETNGTITSNTEARVASDDRSLGGAVINTQELTIFDYQGSIVYIYSALSNENENKTEPQKWRFYYVPIMAPVIDNTQKNDTWIWDVNSEVRMKLMLGNQEVQELARNAITKKYTPEISQYSQFWTVAPLIIDSLVAYVVSGTNSLVQGVTPNRAVNPNSFTITFRFECSSPSSAQLIMSKIKNGDYSIEIAFYFAGFKQVTTNLVSITADQLKNVLSKTAADGGNTNAQYIHRNQAAKFVAKYVKNVKKMIYVENANTNSTSLTNGLEDQFISLLEQAMRTAAQVELSADLYNQVWSSSDLNPDRLTSELSQLFTYNDTESKRHNYTDRYFDLNKEYLKQVSSSESGGSSGKLDVFGLFSLDGDGTGSSSSSNSLMDNLKLATNDKYSLTDIQRLLADQQSKFQWNGEKFIAKWFNVYKLIDLSDYLQVGMISKQLTAEKRNGAIVRQINVLNTPITYANKPSTFLTGTVQIFTGILPPAFPWLLCNGTAISRIEYQHLFSVIGTSYGVGDGSSTFNLPDFRGRFPLGVDESSQIVSNVGKLGQKGGQAMHVLTVEQLPSHAHEQGTYNAVAAGDHSHSYQDPGHNHGGQTGNAPQGSGGLGMFAFGVGSDRASHGHSIAQDTTHITINSGGSHTHEIAGQSGTTGTGQSFSLLSPYQTVNYIIYGD